MRKKFRTMFTLFLVLTANLVLSNPVPALSFNSAPARHWGYTYKSNITSPELIKSPRQGRVIGEKKSEWRVNYTNFPEDAKQAVQIAIDLWASNFISSVPVTVDAVWERDSNGSVLGSARPGFYFNAFPGAADDNLWYPSALANVLARKDLDPKQSEIILKLNSSILWYFGTDGIPNKESYDLSSVVLHEIGHGLGFLSNAEYDPYFGTGYMFQPTPFDAYVQLPDGRTFLDFCSRSSDLGKALTDILVWSGSEGIAANGGVRPKLYTPTPYLDGSSITHLDEKTFSKSSTDALMTPNLEPGESFSIIGSVVLGIISDMLSRPPLRVAADKPSKPINVRALVGDQYALVTFESPQCRRVDQVTGFTVRVSPGGVTKTFVESPAKITGLKNGVSYTFSVTVTNAKGSSDSVTSNAVKPETTVKSQNLDPASRVNNLATTTWRNMPTVVYGDEASGQLKIATYQRNKWTIKKLQEGVRVGHVSLCKNGFGADEGLHIVYADLETKDVIHGFLNKGSWQFETVDGDGKQVIEYSDNTRTKTASDVSVSNACVVTSGGLQVFYRDETQGILLGAVKTKFGWVYEIVDGDKKSNGRTTGDVAFQLVASVLGKSVYLFYDSVVTIAANNSPTEGEVRLATRSTVFVEDWRYTSVDGPDNGAAVAGYALAISNTNNTIAISWLSASVDSLPFANQINFSTIENLESFGSLLPAIYGRPQGPLSIDDKGIVFGCLDRICKTTLTSKKMSLVNGASTSSSSGAILFLDKKRFYVAVINNKLSLLRI